MQVLAEKARTLLEISNTLNKKIQDCIDFLEMMQGITDRFPRSKAKEEGG